MGKPFDHAYRDVSSGRTGTMVCAGCNHPITEGEYRSYKRTKNYDWGYVVHHRACCESDPRWAKLDAERAANKQWHADLLAASIAFRDKWKIGDLDELIEELSEARAA